MIDLLAVLVFLAIPTAVLLTARLLNRRGECVQSWSAGYHAGGAGVGDHAFPGAFAGRYHSQGGE